MKKLKCGDIVVVTETGAAGILIDIQYEHNRYQLKYVSGWQHGIENIESFESWKGRNIS